MLYSYHHTAPAAQLAGQKLAQVYEQLPKHQFGREPCDDRCTSMPLETRWAGQWKGTESFTIPTYVPMYQRDERAWQTDLNSIRFDRAIEQGAHPDPYRFMDGRQMLLQFLTAESNNATNTRDQYMRPVHSLESSTFGLNPRHRGNCKFW